MKSKPGQSEHAEQSLLVEWLTYFGIGCFAVPNSGRRSMTYATKLKREGVRGGAPDLVLTRLSVDGRPIAVEMKAKGGRVSDAQKGVHEELRAEGWEVVVAWSFDEAQRAIAKLCRVGR